MSRLLSVAIAYLWLIIGEGGERVKAQLQQFDKLVYGHASIPKNAAQRTPRNFSSLRHNSFSVWVFTIQNDVTSSLPCYNETSL